MIKSSRLEKDKQKIKENTIKYGSILFRLKNK